MDPLWARFRWTRDEYLAASQVNYDLRCRGWKFRAIGCVLIAMALFGGFTAYSKGTFATLFVGTVLVVYWYLLRWPLYRLQLGRRFSKHSSKDAEITWEINEDGFKGGSVDAKGEISWNAVGRVVVSPRGFLVYQYPIFSWIPRHAFTLPGDADRFERLVQTKVKEFIRAT